MTDFQSIERICRVSVAKFIITPEDQEFYAKINVPLPTLCPVERIRRRFARHNVSRLFQRKCDFTGETIISVYRATSKYKIYRANIYYSDKWDAMEFGRDFDFSRSFFEQFHELLLAVPRIALNQKNNEKCDFTNYFHDSKNCYLCVDGINNQDCIYSGGIVNSQDCVNCYYVIGSELCYGCEDILNCYNTKFTSSSQNCRDSAFLNNCKNCHDCFGCIGLKHKSYCIFNKQYTKAEYENKVKNEFYLGSFKNFQLIQTKFENFKNQFPIHFSSNRNSEDCTGYMIVGSKNCHDCIGTNNSQNVSYSFAYECKDSMDVVSPYSELCYECAAGEKSYNCKFCNGTYGGNAVDLEYCESTLSCQDCFGCAGLKHKQYCIFNKQYTKEEYFDFKKRIIEHMKNTKEYGEFFPLWTSTFPYQDTWGQEFFHVKSDEEAKRLNLYWEAEPQLSQVTDTDYIIADDIKDYSDPAKAKELLSKVLKCEISGRPYKVEIPELKFCLKYELPITRKCFFQCYDEKETDIIRVHFFDRKCDRCQKDIRTVYDKDCFRPVWCEECYRDHGWM